MRTYESILFATMLIKGSSSSSSCSSSHLQLDFCIFFIYVAHFVFLRDVWIRTQRAAVASRRATNLATYIYPSLSHPSPSLSHPSPSLSHPSPSLSHPSPSLSHPSPSLSHHLPHLATHLPLPLLIFNKIFCTKLCTTPVCKNGVANNRASKIRKNARSFGTNFRTTPQIC
jgi:hypothetical protein